MPNSNKYSLDLFYSGSTDQKIATMENLYSVYGEKLQHTKKVSESLHLLKRHSFKLSKHMLEMKLDHLCIRCAGTDSGGCCSSYMEANTNALLLLINKLYGVTVEHQHSSDTECCFLGKTGCILPIKPVFCLNYNCKHIVDQASENEMEILDRLAGKLLYEQTHLESIILESLG